MANALLSLVVEATEHAHRIEVILEQKAKDVVAAAARTAEAVPPELEAAIKSLTEKLASIRKLHESGAAKPVAPSQTAAPAASADGKAASAAAPATAPTATAAAPAAPASGGTPPVL